MVDPTCAIVTVGADKPIRLTGGRVWVVDSGGVDIFAEQEASGEAWYGRTHVVRAEAGQAIFGTTTASPGGWVLLGVGTSDARLWEASEDTLRVLALEEAAAAEVAAMVDQWIEVVYQGITREAMPKGCEELAPGEAGLLAEQVFARPKTPVAWVRHGQGHSHLFGRSELTVNGVGLTPLSRAAWIQAASPVRVEVASTAEVIGKAEAWAGLAHLHNLVLGCAAILAADRSRADAERARRKDAADRGALTEACLRLAATLEAGPVPDLDGREEYLPATADLDRFEALFSACGTVASAARVTLVRPLGTGRKGGPEGVIAIARASRLRIRRVLLQDGWSKRDNGPLIGFRQDGEPVALLPRPGGRYVSVAPALREVALVSPSAPPLAPFGYVFYHSFPTHPLRVGEVLRFGVVGSGRDIATALVCATAAALLSLATPVATGLVFSTIIPEADRSQLLQLTVMLIIIVLTIGLFQATRALALLRLESRMGAVIQAAVWDRILSLPLPFFRRYTAGDLAVRAMGIDAIRQVLSGATIAAVMSGLYSLVNFALMFLIRPGLAAYATLLIGLSIGATALASWKQLRTQRAVAELRTRGTGTAFQLLSSIGKLRVANAEARAFRIWARTLSRQRQLQLKARMVGNHLTTFNAAYPLVAYLVVFSAAVPLLQGDNPLHIGEFLAFVAAFAASLTGTLVMSNAVASALAVVPTYEQARPILVAAPEIREGRADPGLLSGDLDVQHVSFRYHPDGPLILRDVSLEMHAGEFIGLVGPSGSGKSTVLRLLLGFETAESGMVYYDGQDLTGLDVEAVRRQIGVVLQTGRLIPGDIMTNILGSAPLTIHDAWEAARLAGLEPDIQAMPMGMHTVVSEGAGTLSGGQRQRLLIARAIVQRPRLVFFDEATSALDNRTQAIVSQSLEGLRATRVVIAHRLSTIQHADRIYVIERGRVVQHGGYTELLGVPGPFAELARRQLA